MDATIHRQPQIHFETADWLVINKPAGWHGAAGKSEPTVEGWLRAEVAAGNLVNMEGDLPEMGLVHRLDHMTSGCLLAARNRAAYDRLRSAMQSDAMEVISKTYLAIVSPANIQPGEFAFLFSSRHKRSKKVTVRDLDSTGRTGHRGEIGRCRWRVRACHDPGALLEVDLIGPGRRHQIRAGLAHMGFPLLGDTLYGGPVWRDARLGLHAWRLVVDDVCVEIEPDRLWQDVMTVRGHPA